MTGPRALLTLSLALGCATQTTYRLPSSVTSAPSAPGAATTAARDAHTAATMTMSPVETHCQRGAPETCDGVDEDCDGTIDEGCGYGPGEVQVTASWETGADVDLSVTDPTGETVSATHRQSSSGGVLDREARAGCPRVDALAVEDVRWSRSPPPGTYTARVTVYDDCGTRTTTPVTVSVAVRGRTLGAWRVTFVRTGQSATLSFPVEATRGSPR